MSLTPIEKERLRCAISDHLAEIEAMFKPGCKVSVIIRNPSRPDNSGDVFVGNDDIGDAIHALQIRQQRGDE